MGLSGALPGLQGVDGPNAVLVERDEVQGRFLASGGPEVIGDAEGTRGVEVVGELGAVPNELVYYPPVRAVGGPLCLRIEAQSEAFWSVQAPTRGAGRDPPKPPLSTARRTSHCPED